MTGQTTTPAAAGGNTGTDTTARDADGFVDFDALAGNPPTEELHENDDFGEGESEGGNANADAEAEKAKAEAEAKAKEGQEQKRLSGAQRAKQQRIQLLDQIAERDRELAELRKASQKPAADAGDAPKTPKEEDFNGDWFAYQRALAVHEASEAARKATAETLKASETSAQRDRATREARERNEAHMERVEKARETIADYDAVMEGMKEVRVRDMTISEIMSSDKSDLIAYHFATNPDELTAFDNMAPREQAREIGRLEATLKMPEPKKATTAPPPLSKPKGGATPKDQTSELNAWLDKKYGKNRSR